MKFEDVSGDKKEREQHFWYAFEQALLKVNTSIETLCKQAAKCWVEEFTRTNEEAKKALSELFPEFSKDLREKYINDRDALIIDSPLTASQIKKIVLNGVTIPVDGVCEAVFAARPSEACKLTVTRYPKEGK